MQPRSRDSGVQTSGPTQGAHGQSVSSGEIHMFNKIGATAAPHPVSGGSTIWTTYYYKTCASSCRNGCLSTLRLRFGTLSQQPCWRAKPSWRAAPLGCPIRTPPGELFADDGKPFDPQRSISMTYQYHQLCRLYEFDAFH